MTGKHRLWLLVVILAALAGCKRSPSSPKPVVIEVISDPAQVLAAKKAWADDRETQLVRLLKHPETIRSYDDESLALIREQRERSIAALQRLRDDSSKPAEPRIHAIFALANLDIAASPEQLAALAGNNGEAAHALLSQLRSQDLGPDPEPLAEPLRQFIVGSIGSGDSRVSSAAVHLATWRNISEAADVILAQIRQRSTPDIALLKAAARLRPSAEILDQLQRQLRPEPFGAKALGPIADLAEATKDPALQERAARICAEFLKQQPNQPWIDGDTSSAVSALAKVQPPETAKALLQDLVRSARWKLVKDAASDHLKELDAKATGPATREAGPKASNLASNAPPADVRAIAATWTRHGVVTTAEAERAAAEYTSKHATNEQEFGGAEGFLAYVGRLLIFDAETGMVPNRHDLLLTEFANASAGLFRPEAALERYSEPKDDETGRGKYVVQFIHKDKLYRFEPNDLGDWYDVAAMVGAVHRALQDAGIAERFVSLESDGQMASFIFGKPGQVQAAAQELGLKLGQDLDQARKLGKAYEDQVFQNLKQ